MLVLKRKLGEKILIGKDVNIIALGTQGNQIKIGIEAPESVNIVREELLGRDSKSRKFWEKLILKKQNKICEPFVNH
ncbi:MAG: carbon storage regulator [Gammaproteobacteria bacterium]|nr:carbon storage regulator [Gammaproteobacteria bacterium]